MKGIGEKTAAQLINEHGDLAGVRRAAADPVSKLTPAKRRGILEASDYLDVAPKVVTVAPDVPLPAFNPALPTEPADPEVLEALAAQWGLGSSLMRLLDALDEAH